MLGAVAGARRTDTAYQRFLGTQHAAALVFEDFIPNPDAPRITHEQVTAVAGVAASERVRSFDFLDASPAATVGKNVNLVATPDGRAYGSGLDRPKVLKGRLPDPGDAFEVAVDFTLPHAHVGDRLTFQLPRNLGGDTRVRDEHAMPIAVTVQIVGVVAVPGQFPPQTPNSYFTGSNVYATPAFDAMFGPRTVALELDFATLVPGSNTLGVQQAAQALGDGKQVPVVDPAAQDSEVARSTHLEAVALWCFAGLLALFGLLVISQILGRAAALESTDDPTLRAMGVNRAQLLGFGMVRTGAIGVVGASIAVGVAIALSRFTPIGLARSAEPHPGIAVDGAVLAVGSALVVVITMMAALPSLWRSSRSAEERTVGGTSVIATRLTSAIAPPAASCGLRMAFEPGRGATAVPVRSTIVSAVLALTALAAAIAFGASLTHLLRVPRLYGVTWDADVLNGQGPDGLAPAAATIRADPDITAASYRYANLGVRINGVDTEGVALIPVSGSLDFAVADGRAPHGDAEIALGTRTMDALHLHLNDTVHAIAENENAAPVALTVVGRVVLPPGSFVGRLGQGVVIDDAAAMRMADVASGFELRRPYIISVQYRAGVDPAGATNRLRTALVATDPQFEVDAPPTPNDLLNFGRIDDLPVLLAGLLAALASITIMHLLLSSARRRRHDLAILKILGFDRGQVRATVAWQASAVAAFAAIIGVPLGAAAGRAAWHVFADNLGVVPDPVTAAPALLLIVPAAIVLANVAAIAPAVMASRIKPSTALREP